MLAAPATQPAHKLGGRFAVLEVEEPAPPRVAFAVPRPADGTHELASNNMEKQQKQPTPTPPTPPTPPAAVAFGIAKLSAALAHLDEPRCVAVVTLRGSLCPITNAHVQTLIQARQLLLGKKTTATRPEHLEQFGAVVGAISLNSDRHVGAKLHEKGDPSLSLVQRRRLVKQAIKPYAWLGCETGEGALIPQLKRRFPQHEFVHFSVNGADDVLRFAKYLHAREDKRIISMGRPGLSCAVELKASQSGVDLDKGRFVIGPELKDISSSKVRLALQTGDHEAAKEMLPPEVYKWCVNHGPWQCVA